MWFFRKASSYFQKSEEVDMKKSNTMRGRSYSVQEPMGKDPREAKRVRFNIPGSSSGSSRNNSRSSESLEIHLEPQSIASDSVLNIIFQSKAAAQPPEPEPKPKPEPQPSKPFPKRRMTVVEKLVEFQQNLFMEIDQPSDGLRRPLRTRAKTYKTDNVKQEKKAEFKVKEEKKLKKTEAVEPPPTVPLTKTAENAKWKRRQTVACPTNVSKNSAKVKKAEEGKKKETQTPEKPAEPLPVVEAPAQPAPLIVDKHSSLTLSQARIESHLRRGDIREALITLRTGFATTSGCFGFANSSNLVATDSFTLSSFPQSFSFGGTRQNVLLGAITPQHTMIQLKPGAGYIGKEFNITILVLSGVVQFQIDEPNSDGKKYNIQTLSVLRVKAGVSFKLKNVSEFDAICFLNFESTA